ncbi:unnamed protein product [Rotaria sp. Silwood1]|nr:unnamed protein product [Rotaria sp. Silwood1]CAF3622746.1 unnamed protein product [Rotaria sp. Silwood1]CAF4726125.1 unnamed protein product [Rotaria sp. Silwood1]CAF4892514.1 unnamed protein product [Rotaria sp. Silwood1]
MDNKNPNKRNATLDNFFISSKKPRDENNSPNGTSISPCSSSSSPSSSSTTTNVLVPSSLSNECLTVVGTSSVTNSSLNTEISSSKSSSKGCPADISQRSQDLPVQPRLTVHPTDNENRSFQVRWYIKRDWLEYSVERDAVFCYYCRHFSQFGTPTRIQRDAFTTYGFNNWKRALATDRGFHKHVKSQTHITSLANFSEYKSREKSNASVINVLEKPRAEQILHNRSKLIKISSAILLCVKQLIALRGHDESTDSNNRGNLIEILKWSAKTDPLAKAVLEESAGNATYLSHQIQNELLSIMANQIRDNIAKKLNGNVYVLLADEATDVSPNKQLSICLRAVDDQNQIKEYLMGFVRLCRFNAATQAKEISDFLIKHNIHFSMCIAQRYDGYDFNIKKWANTRWDSRFKSIDSIKSNYSAVLEALRDLIHDGGNRAVDARGVCTDLGSTHNLIIIICEQLNLMRNESSFKELFQQAIIFGNENGIDINGLVRTRRQKSIPSRFKDCIITTSAGHRDYNNSEENFRVTMYLPTIDSILVALNERFSCHNLQIAKSITSLSPNNGNFLDIETLQPLIDHLSLEKKTL